MKKLKKLNLSKKVIAELSNEEMKKMKGGTGNWGQLITNCSFSCSCGGYL